MHGKLMQIIAETVSIKRQDANDRYNLIDVIDTIKIAIVPNNQPNTILATGEVLTHPRFVGYLLTPDDRLQEGQVVIRAEPKKRLFIRKVDRIINTQRLHLDETAE